ncbi:Down syndrome cell adhesion molecule Dscam2, partial, partial [Paramuricea clavata]
MLLPKTPSSGVTIANVTALNSTSLKITWEAVASANESITGYTVCYSLNASVNCSNSDQKTVGNDTLSTIITGLNVFTKYYVAVKASTAAGAGPLGGEMEGTTDQA